MEKTGTQKDFITAFWELYENSPVEKISISRLCKTAGYNRSTFYNHFNDIYDLMDKAVSDIIIPIKEHISDISDYRQLIYNGSMGQVLFDCFHRSDRHIEALFKREGHHVLIKQIKNLILMHSFETVIPDEKRIVWEILMEYQLSAVFGVISYWYRTDKKIPSEEIFQTLREISAKGIISSIKAELDTID